MSLHSQGASGADLQIATEILEALGARCAVGERHTGVPIGFSLSMLREGTVLYMPTDDMSHQNLLELPDLREDGATQIVRPYELRKRFHQSGFLAGIVSVEAQGERTYALQFDTPLEFTGNPTPYVPVGCITEVYTYHPNVSRLNHELYNVTSGRAAPTLSVRTFFDEIGAALERPPIPDELRAEIDAYSRLDAYKPKLVWQSPQTLEQ